MKLYFGVVLYFFVSLIGFFYLLLQWKKPHISLDNYLYNVHVVVFILNTIQRDISLSCGMSSFFQLSIMGVTPPINTKGKFHILLQRKEQVRCSFLYFNTSNICNEYFSYLSFDQLYQFYRWFLIKKPTFIHIDFSFSLVLSFSVLLIHHKQLIGV